MSITSDVLSAIAANRKSFFELVEAAEQQCACEIDEVELQSEIDSNFDGRESLTHDEAHTLLMKVSRPRPEKKADGGNLRTA